MLCDDISDTWRKWPDVGMWLAYLKSFGEGYWNNAWSESMACRCCWGFFVADCAVRNPTSLITPAVFFLFASDDVTSQGGRTEYVENFHTPPSRKPIASSFYLFLLSQPFKTQEFWGGSQKPISNRVLEGYFKWFANRWSSSSRYLHPPTAKVWSAAGGTKWAPCKIYQYSFKGWKIFAGEEVLEMTKFFIKKRVVWSCIWESYLQ